MKLVLSKQEKKLEVRVGSLDLFHGVFIRDGKSGIGRELTDESGVIHIGCCTMDALRPGPDATTT
jgi:hypothetical protein